MKYVREPTLFEILFGGLLGIAIFLYTLSWLWSLVFG
jgi:hypothetical protein